MKIKYKKCGILAAALLSATLLFGTALGASAAQTVTVTYKTPFFRDVVKTTEEGGIPDEVFLPEVYGDITPGHSFYAPDLSVVWYKDAAYAEPYGFGEPLTADTTLYGKLEDGGERYFRSNGFGWDVQFGKVYAGDPINDNYITTDSYTNPSYVDEETGVTSFSLNGAKYAAYGRGLDVSKPFTVDFDYTNVTADGLTAWFEYSLFPSLTLAQAAGLNTWGNKGAASVLMFNHGNGGAPQAFTVGSAVAGATSTTVTEYPNAGADFKAMFANGNTETKISLTANITDMGTTFTSAAGTVVATSPAKRADFPTGYAYFSIATNGSPVMSVGVDVAVKQESGALTAKADAGATIGELTVKGTMVTLPITVKEGYELKSVTFKDAEVAAVRLRGQENLYALDLPVWGKDGEISVVTASTKSQSSGCKGSLVASSVALAAAATGVALIFALKKSGLEK